MKLSNATLLAVLATASFVSAAPTEHAFESTALVTRQDATDLLDILSELKTVNAKRDLAEGDDHTELSKRADSLIGQLITALANSGIIGEIWTTMTTDPAIKSELGALIKGAVQQAIVSGPALIKAFWNSGLIGNVFKTLLNDADLKSVLLGIAKSLFSTASNILLSYGKGGSTTAAAAPAPAATPAAYKREDVLDKRDLASLITTIVTEIKNSGIVSSLINKVLADPQKSISLLTTALSKGVVLFQDVYGWAKQSGVLDSALNYLKNNGGSIVKALGSFLAGELSSGGLSASDINNAPGTAVGTTTATAAAAPAAAAPAATTAATVYKRMLY
ncbi:hypothetical protein CAAN1_03S06084 [[Candida] anglica]|uniref:Opaque-phase-specific protein OP4 n=1 Tax=[Candida] anglica TaxID=148631 RepID=A0ABP0EH70_9ASCO